MIFNYFYCMREIMSKIGIGTVWHQNLIKPSQKTNVTVLISYWRDFFSAKLFLWFSCTSFSQRWMNVFSIFQRIVKLKVSIRDGRSVFGESDIRYTGKNRLTLKLSVSQSLDMIRLWFFYHSAKNYWGNILGSNFVIWPQKVKLQKWPVWGHITLHMKGNSTKILKI